jgi:hypothetical protein
VIAAPGGDEPKRPRRAGAKPKGTTKKKSEAKA